MTAEPKRTADPRKPADLRKPAGVLLAVAALGAAPPILGLLVLPEAQCAGERGGSDSTSGAWCELFAILLSLPSTALVAGCLAAALRPTWRRFLSGLGGLAGGGVMAILAWSEPLAPDLFWVLALSAPAFATGYAIVGGFFWALAART